MTTDSLLKSKYSPTMGNTPSHDAAFLTVIARCLELGGFAPAEAIDRAREIRSKAVQSCPPPGPSTCRLALKSRGY